MILVLVTGTSPGGLGAETARVVAKYGANLVILAGRNIKTLVILPARSPCSHI